ncbi:MAG: YhdP family protein [Gammaproteobacteria bacterium]|nr:YhdP family protein [Gammaproteobacteria bacterium]
MNKYVKTVWYVCWYAIVTGLVLAAVTLGLARILLPIAEDYRVQVEQWVTDVIDHPVRIESLDADWQGTEPQLVLRGISFLNSEDGKPFLQFAAAKIGINLFTSLFTGTVQPGTLVVVGADLKIARETDGSFTIGAINTGSPDTANDFVSRWLFERDTLRMEQSRLLWEDHVMGWQPRELHVSELVLHNDDDMHYLRGSVGLPSELGRNFDFSAELLGSPVGGNGWHGSFYIAAQDVLLDAWLPDQSKNEWQLINGRADLRAWSEWRNGRMEKTYGSVGLQNVLVMNADSASLMGYDTLNSNFAFTHQDSKWHVLLNDFSVSNRGRQWKNSSLTIALDTETKQLQASASYIDLAFASEMLLMSEVLANAQQTQLSRSALGGGLRNLQLGFRDGETAQYFLTARAENISARSHGAWPGFKNLSGNLQLNNSGGSFVIDSQKLQFDSPTIFDHVIRADVVQGKVTWLLADDGVSLDFSKIRIWNSDIDVAVHGNILLPKNAAPFIDMHAALNRPVQVNKATAYLPTGIIPPGAVHWTRDALRDGVAKGEFVFYGDMAKFPFANNEGKFELRLDVHRGVLNYYNGWPVINGIEGRFELTANGLRFDATQGRIFNTQLHDVAVSLPDFHRGDLLITGSAKGSSADKLKYLHQSPLEEIFAKHIQPIVLAGNSDLALELKIPLATHDPVQVKGHVDFAKNQFKADAWLVDVRDLNGRLKFDEHGIYSDGLTGRFGGVLPLKLTATTEQGADESRIVLKNNGRISAAQLKYLLKHFADQEQLAAWFTGSTNVATKIDIAISGKNAGNVDVRADSPLTGMLVDLPEPLKKNGEERRNFTFQMHIGHALPQLEFNYGDIYSILELQHAENQTEISRGAVGFGRVVKLPGEHGYRFIGEMDKFSWAQWKPLLLPEKTNTGLIKSSGGATASMFFDVTVKQGELFGLKLQDLSVQASNSVQGWSVSVDGPQLKGDMFIPLVMRSAPLVMNMDRMIINVDRQPATGKGDNSLRPSEMPELRITSTDFRYNNIRFGQLQLDTRRTDKGMKLDTLAMRTATTRITAKGEWQEQKGQQLSKFDIVVDSESLGQALSDWGYAETIANGTTKMNISARWPGTPIDFTFRNLTGTASLNVKDGRLLDVKPGAARLFGLLSVQTLPRRLILDFSDVFAKGMQFDTLKGDFKIENGKAFTSGLAMDGPAAQIDMAGQIDLAAGQYDQVVTIVPKVGASLPVLGALTVAPQVGATLFLLQKVFEKQIDEVSTIQYSVRGPWEQPIIEKIEKPPVAVPPEILD